MVSLAGIGTAIGEKAERGRAETREQERIDLERERLDLAQQDMQARLNAQMQETNKKSFDEIVNLIGDLAIVSETMPEESRARIMPQIEQLSGLAMSNAQKAGIPDEVAMTHIGMVGRTKIEAAARGEAIGDVAAAQARVGAIEAAPEELQPQLASALGITTGKGSSEFITLLNELETARRSGDEGRAQMLLNRIDRLSRGEGGPGFAATIDKEGNVSISFGEKGVPQKAQLAGAKIDELRAQSSTLDTGMKMTDYLLEQVEQDPSFFGMVGTGRKAAETATGVTKDLAGATLRFMGVDAQGFADQFAQIVEFEKEQGTSQAVQDALAPTTVGEVAVFESALRYSVARALQPEGKLLASTVEAASDMTNLTGLTSSSQVRERLESINNILRRSRSEIQRRLEQGVGGETEIVSPPPQGTSDGRTVAPGAPVLSPQDIANMDLGGLQQIETPDQQPKSIRDAIEKRLEELGF